MDVSPLKMLKVKDASDGCCRFAGFLEPQLQRSASLGMPESTSTHHGTHSGLVWTSVPLLSPVSTSQQCPWSIYQSVPGRSILSDSPERSTIQGWQWPTWTCLRFQHWGLPWMKQRCLVFSGRLIGEHTNHCDGFCFNVFEVDFAELCAMLSLKVFRQTFTFCDLIRGF